MIRRIHGNQKGLAAVLHEIDQCPSTSCFPCQNLGRAARQNPVFPAQLRQARNIAIKGAGRVEMVAPTRAPAFGEHGCALHGEALLGTIVNHRDAGQCHHHQ